MKKTGMIALLMSLAILSSANAVGIYEKEIKIDSTIEFENYSGPHAKVDSLESINSIGSSMGSKISSSTEQSQTISFNGKYSVIHVIGKEDGSKLDADILIIDSSASVDHIKNLRRIIASYISSAYGYSYQDASTLATFVTVYNAVYRGDLNTFNAKYKSEVVSNLTKDKCGLSTKWSEWPGRSQIVIPLYDVTKGLSTIDTSVISDKQVINSMKEEDDRGIDERKNLVDLKEREAEEASDRAKDAAKEAADEAKKLDEQKANQKAAEQEAKDAQKEAEEAKKEAEADPENEEKQKAAEEAEQKAEEAKEKAEEEAKKTEEQKQKADEAKSEAAEEQAFSDKKQKEANTDRKEIAQDQKELLNVPSDEDLNLVTGLKLNDSDAQTSTIVKLNADTGAVVKTSPVTVVRGRTILPVYDTDASGNPDMDSLQYMAICGENSGNGAIKLCLLDASTLEITDESDEVLSENSVLVQSGEDYYCVIKDGSSWVTAKFDKNLKLIKKSNVAVNAATPITVTPKGIIVTNKSSRPVLLALEDLSLISVTETSTTAGGQPYVEK